MDMLRRAEISTWKREPMEEIPMKTAILIAAALVIFTSVPIKAQQAGATAQVSGEARGSANGSVSGGSVSGSASASEEMRPVNAELVGKLDSKSAKVGDRVEMKTTESMKAADGTVIPKGTRLVGHVASVSAHGKGSADSAMRIDIDRAELKGGQSMMIRSEIRSVAPPASAAMSSAMQSDDSMSGPMGGPVGGGMGGGARAMGGGRLGGGGLLGGGAVSGVAGSTMGGAANATGRAGAGLGAAADNGIGAAGHIAGNTAGSVGERDGLVVNAAGGAVAHATGVRGVMLAGDATGKASGTLSATNRNVHLDGGTQMVLGISEVR